MKQRITYIVSNPDEFSPDQLQVDQTSFSVKGLEAAKEHRITFGLRELPREISLSFDQWRKLHIRWVSEQPYEAIPPFTSRVTPGLHAFLTPFEDKSRSQLCAFLHSSFGRDLKCSSTNETSTKYPDPTMHLRKSATNQYYSHLPSLQHLVSYVERLMCKPSSGRCKELASSLLRASYIDIDYDSSDSAVVRDTVVLTAFWSESPKGDSWTEKITLPKNKNKKDQKVEIGVLNHEPNPDPEDIGFGGFLTVLGEDKTPKPTQFQVPARHYPLSSSLTYTASFDTPTGLHPVLRLSFPRSTLTPPDPSCSLSTYITLPSPLFIDKYQFHDQLFRSSHNLRDRYIVTGASDLEAPDWVTLQWGSTALFELASPPSSEDIASEQGEWNATVPMHLRYMPAAEGGYAQVPVPWPVVFWACHPVDGGGMSSNPFDRINLGYDTLFGIRQQFIHVPPRGADTLVEWISVPVLDMNKTSWVQMGTIGTVVLTFFGICWMLFGNISGRNTEPKDDGKIKKKQ